MIRTTKTQELFSNKTARRLLRHKWLLAGAGSGALFCMAAALALVPEEAGNQPEQKTIVEELGAIGAVLPQSETVYLREEQVRRSDTLSSLLTRLGVSDQPALNFLTKDARAGIIARQLRPGKTVSAETTTSGELISLFFPLNDGDSEVIVKRNTDGFSLTQQPLRLDVQTSQKTAVISTSLFAATDAAGIPDSIATQLAEIFSGDIDFYRDLRQGDRFTVVYETLRNKGLAVRTGRILGAEFVNGGTTYTAYWYQNSDGSGAYYTASGNSLRKAFLRSPLEFSRVTSGYSSARLHPVLQITRAHKGIDYGAPTGTPVRAVADATVELAARQNGYGNLIVLKHQGPYSTAYGHLNAFAPGVRKGAKVKQGETIGFVGQTGLATGPHLHYEFRIDGAQANPAKVANIAPPPLKTSEVARFKSTIKQTQAELNLVKQSIVASSE